MAESYHAKGTTSTGGTRKPAPATVQVVHDYHSAVNAIIEPDKFVACTRYFVRRWMPLLGNEGTRIVLALRSLGYHNPATGETRNGIEIELRDLAALVGTSLPTLKREFADKPGQPGVPQNPTLRRLQALPAPSSKAQNEPREAQNEPALIDYSSIPKITSLTAALPGDSPSSLGEQTSREKTSEEKTEAERAIIKQGAAKFKAALDAAERTAALDAARKRAGG